MLFTTHLAPSVMIDPTKASSVKLNPNILREYIGLALIPTYPPPRNQRKGRGCVIIEGFALNFYPLNPN